MAIDFLDPDLDAEDLEVQAAAWQAYRAGEISWPVACVCLAIVRDDIEKLGGNLVQLEQAWRDLEGWATIQVLELCRQGLAAHIVPYPQYYGQTRCGVQLREFLGTYNLDEPPFKAVGLTWMEIGRYYREAMLANLALDLAQFRAEGQVDEDDHLVPLAVMLANGSIAPEEVGSTYEELEKLYRYINVMDLVEGYYHFALQGALR